MLFVRVNIMEKYKISLNDRNSNYFHFTLRENLNSIEKNGLLPKKGTHAKYIEDSEKVFFVKGLDNLLILFDCWITVYKKVPILPNSKLTYGVSSKVMQSRFFPMFLVDIYFFLIRNSKRQKEYAYKIFDELLDNCVLLNLDIREGIDFRKDDVDEIKAKGFRKRHLIELGYSEKYSDLSSSKMDDWNLHTLKNRGISIDKLKLCHIDGCSNMRDIFSFALENTKLDLKDVCPVLCDYLDNRNYYEKRFKKQ